MKRMLLIVLAFVLLLSGCSGLADRGISLEGLDQSTMLYASNWFQLTMPELEVIEEGSAQDGISSRCVLSDNSGLWVHLYEYPENPGVISLVKIGINPGADEEATRKYRELSVAAAVHFFAGVTQADAELLLDIEPVADVSYTYEGDPNVHTAYYPEPNSFIAQYSTFTGSLKCYTSLNDNRQEFEIYPPIPCGDPIAQQLRDSINAALNQAGHPISLSFAGLSLHSSSAVIVEVDSAGSGGEDYLKDIEIVALEVAENSLPPYFAIETKPGTGEKVKEAVRLMFRTAVSHYGSTFDDAFLDAFFEMENYRKSEVTIYNQLGTSVHDSFSNDFTISHETEKIHLRYSEYEDGSVFCSVEIPREELFVSNSVEPILLEDFSRQFLELYPEVGAPSRGVDPTEYNIWVPFPWDSNDAFRVGLTVRAQDRAITEIRAQCQLGGDVEKEQWFRQVTADIATLCCKELTPEAALELYENTVDNGDVKGSNYYEQGIHLSVFYDDNGVFFNLYITSEELSATDNIFREADLWDGPSVVDGKFHWLENSWGYEISGYCDVYFEEVDMPFQVEHKDTYDFVWTEKDEIFDYRRISLEHLGYLDESHYALFVFAQPYTRVLLCYDENAAQYFDLPEGYYYEGTRPEEIRHLPICLSLMFDLGMTEAEAQALFSHTLEPTANLSGNTVTLYCPRDVAHILVRDPQTGYCEYTVMTKDEFDTRFGGSLDAYIESLN